MDSGGGVIATDMREFLDDSVYDGRLIGIDPNGTVATIASGYPLVDPVSVAMDINGDYIVVDGAAGDPIIPGDYTYRYGALFRVAPNGTVTEIIRGSPFGIDYLIPKGVAVAGDGDYWTADLSTLYLVD